MAAAGHIWSIPPSAPFLPALADALSDGTLLPGGDPAALERATILLPTMRARRRLEALLLERSGRRAMMLPAIRTLTGIEADQIVDGLDEAEEDLPAASDVLLRPVVPPLVRHLELTRLALAWRKAQAGLVLPNSGTPPAAPTQAGEAAHFAAELARLIDSLEIEEIDPSAIGQLAEGRFADYWDVLLKFLAIATEAWRDHKAEAGAVDAAERRSLLIDAFAAKLAADRPGDAIIAAGSTGSVPATARLLKTIAGLPCGHVVLPGLDTALDAQSFAAVDGAEAPHPGHPQFGLASLLAALGETRETVSILGGGRADPARDRLVSETMRPAATTHLWAGHAAGGGKALDGIRLATARDDREEALTIALAMRKALETPRRTVALVTPDRTLARRVAAELRRWEIEAADSAGTPLAETPAGRLARLIAEAMALRLPPDLALAILHHPLSRFRDHSGLAALEILALRGPRPAPWSGGIAQALAAHDAEDRHAPPPVRRAREELAEATALAASFSETLAPFESIAAVEGALPLGTLAQKHLETFDALAALPDAGTAPMRALLQEIAAAAPALMASPRDYPGLLASLLAGRSVRAAAEGHPRLQILGALEARLLDADLTILSGLNEGTWPGEAQADPFLDRASRREVGLPAPERRIGLAAHDFAQALAGREVLLTRAELSGGKPAIASRWLQRLATVIGEDAFAGLEARGASLLAVARALDRRIPQARIAEPRPTPPVAARPRRISASRITTLIRDPYAIYAADILKLAPLPGIGEEIGAAERGTAVHEAIAAYIAMRAQDPTGDPRAQLRDAGDRAFAAHETSPALMALWRRQFARLADWYVGWERGRDLRIAADATEKLGRHVLALAGGDYTLSAQADRILLLEQGGIEIIDYKTGAAPTATQVITGLEPQLTIQGAMARLGAWGPEFAGEPVSALRYLRLSGGHPPGEDIEIKQKAKKDEEPFDPTQGADEALEGLARLLDAYDRDDQPYLVKPRVAFRNRWADYDHLSRFAEWSAYEGTDGESGE
ncbi:MAG: double-strand break repair protein AddB [Flavobacteriaceae bacterium]